MLKKNKNKVLNTGYGACFKYPVCSRIQIGDIVELTTSPYGETVLAKANNAPIGILMKKNQSNQ